MEYIKKEIARRWYILVWEHKQLLKAGLTIAQIKELVKELTKKSKQKNKKVIINK